jgi:hypothetical protein
MESTTNHYHESLIKRRRALGALTAIAAIFIANEQR